MLFRGFDDEFWVPHSRNTTILREDIEKVPELKILSCSETAGVYAVKTQDGRQVFLMGHAEYDRDTLKREYLRDVAANVPIHVPEHYFPGDDPEKTPLVTWRSCAHLLYGNWLNYFVYQTCLLYTSSARRVFVSRRFPRRFPWSASRCRTASSRRYLRAT